ncbi:MAG: UDP-N-acetylglucosamine 1-carboxyvinyltransferase, partial [Saprospiraceae bacterium]|nr:UDP-N-acetylglucosamine 1-carboxyvinyltransferase [Saprospiraceae bacterium]
MVSDVFVVEGGRQLQGELTPQGAKNEALQVICATMMTDQSVEISNIPDIRDVRKLIELLIGLGVEVEQPTAD